MKKLEVTEDSCIGCGSCIAVDPEHFDFNDDGLAKVISETNLETNSLNNAVGSCPTGAIVVNEVEGCASCEGCSGCTHEEKNCTCDDNCECDDSCNCGCK